MMIYHHVWLKAHPNRTAAWLQARLVDGFHIHHIDGDKCNNTATNLVLIEGADHLKLHGLDVYAKAKQANRQRRKAKPKPVHDELVIEYQRIMRAIGHSAAG